MKPGGLLMCPVGFLKRNGSFVQAGFDGFKFVVASTPWLGPSSNVPSSDVPHTGWLFALVVTTKVEQLIGYFGKELSEELVGLRRVWGLWVGM